MSERSRAVRRGLHRLVFGPVDPIELPPRPPPSSALVERLRERLLQQVTGQGVTAATSAGPRALGYEVTHELGRGGMGEVWAAQDAQGRPVALKVMRLVALDEQGRRRFVKEAHALSELDHDGVVAVLDVGATEDQRPFLVMERLDGPTLAEHVIVHAPLSWEDARSILMQLASALAVAHAHGIVHRDLKPTNVMLVEGGRCKLIDFGLARHEPTGREASCHTVTGQQLGTPAYMSPEQLRGETADARSDIYALGCIAHELLTGQRPFGSGTPQELYFRHLGQPVPRPIPLSLPDPLRPAVEAIVLRMLRKRADNRFASMGEVLAAIDAVGPGAAPVEVPDETTWNAQPPPARTKPWARATFGLAVVAVGVGGWVLGRGSPEVASTRSMAPAGSARLVAGSDVPAIEQDVVVPPSQTATHVTSGVGFACVQGSAGDIKCWGSDSRGRLGRGSNGSNVGDNEFPRETPPLQLPADRPVAQLISGPGSRHACIRFVDGGARCWGFNIKGQLGLGSTEIWGDDVPETVAAAADLAIPAAVEIVPGSSSTCAVLRDGSAVCWGAGENGIRGHGGTDALGDDKPLDESLPRVELGGRRVTTVAMGWRHACALLDDQTVRCWGAGDYGQLGVPGWSAAIGDGVGDGHGRGERPDDPSLAVAGLDDVEVVDVTVGGNRSCVLTSKGTVRCWGINTDGRLGYEWSTAAGCSDPKACIVDHPLGDLDLPGSRVIEVGMGPNHACALDDRGRVSCWGSQIWGRLGDGLARSLPTAATNESAVAVQAKVVQLGDLDGDGVDDRVAQISMGDEQGCARMVGGTIRCWGHGTGGRLGYASSDTIGDDETPAAYYSRIGVGDIPIF